jgi:hypothetical protein
MNVHHPVLQHEPDSAEADQSDDLPKDDTSDEVTSAQEDVKKASNSAPMQKRRRVTRACDEVSLLSSCYQSCCLWYCAGASMRDMEVVLVAVLRSHLAKKSMPTIWAWCDVVQSLSGCSSNDKGYTQQIERQLAAWPPNHPGPIYIYLTS